MTMTNHARDLALRAVGRNVVSFQLLERKLKRLASLESIVGTLPEIRQKHEKRMGRLSKSTLGSAIAGWLSILDHTNIASDLPEDLFDVTARFAFTFKMTDEDKERHVDALYMLLDERNTLIHDRLLSIDWDSAEHCRSLTSDLDAQNERIKKELDFFVPIFNMISEFANDLKHVDWAEVISEMQQQPSDEVTPNQRPESHD